MLEEIQKIMKIEPKISTFKTEYLGETYIYIFLIYLYPRRFGKHFYWDVAKTDLEKLSIILEMFASLADKDCLLGINWRESDPFGLDTALTKILNT